VKYYTQDLLGRFGSENDAIAAAAQREWEERSDQYVAHLQTIRLRLSRRLIEFLDRYDLHDATAINLGRSDAEFYISLLLESPQKEWLTLRYELAWGMEPELIRNEIAPEDQRPVFQWLYDEVDIMTSGRLGVFTHSILFTNGLELRLYFYEMDFFTASPWLSAGGIETTGASVLSRT
jgi:hypothetical protein